MYHILDKCSKRPFRSSLVYFSYYKSWKEVQVVPQAVLDRVPDDALSFIPFGPLYIPKQGALFKVISDPRVFVLIGLERHWIAGEGIFRALGYAAGWVEDVADEVLNRFKEGPSVEHEAPVNSFISHPGSSKVYRIEIDPKDPTKKVKRWVKNEAAFKRFDFRPDRVLQRKD